MPVNTTSPTQSASGSPTYVNSPALGYGNVPAVAANNSYGSEGSAAAGPLYHQSAAGNCSPYYSSGGPPNAAAIAAPYQLFHSAPQSVSPSSSSAVSAPSTPGTLYNNVLGASAANPLANLSSYGASAWHPVDYYPNSYHYQSSGTDYVPIISDLE